MAVEDREIREALAAARHVLAGHGAVLVLSFRAHPILQDRAARLLRRRRRRRAGSPASASAPATRGPSWVCILGRAAQPFFWPPPRRRSPLSLQLRRRQKLLRSEVASSRRKLAATNWLRLRDEVTLGRACYFLAYFTQPSAHTPLARDFFADVGVRKVQNNKKFCVLLPERRRQGSSR